ncbi:hypothetical protein BHM03_00031447 [Ensete ventricosum]|nr:hypothetical protein BHM03_00031447 [Ensete ventricosum]
MASSLSRLGMVMNTRSSNSPHLYELCKTLSVIAQYIPRFMVSSFAKRPTLNWLEGPTKEVHSLDSFEYDKLCLGVCSELARHPN